MDKGADGSGRGKDVKDTEIKRGRDMQWWLRESSGKEKVNKGSQKRYGCYVSPNPQEN